jgi:hypothetical protein
MLALMRCSQVEVRVSEMTSCPRLIASELTPDEIGRLRVGNAPHGDRYGRTMLPDEREISAMNDLLRD